MRHTSFHALPRHPPLTLIPVITRPFAFQLCVSAQVNVNATMGKWPNDYVHLSDAGYRLVAENVFRALKPAIESSSSSGGVGGG